MAVRRCKKDDLRHICKATGATMLLSMNNLEGEESFDAASLGAAEEVVQTRVSDNEFIQIKGTKNSSTASIILRGPNNTMLEEMERSVHDSLCAVKRAMETGAIVPGVCALFFISRVSPVVHAGVALLAFNNVLPRR